MSFFRRLILISIVVAVAASASGLGRWQLRRLRDRKASNAILIAAGHRPPQDLPGGLARGEPVDSGRQLSVRGRFDTTDQIILRGHVQDDGPGIQIVTPFMIDSSQAVLWVLRGFVRSPDAVTPPDRIPAPDTGTITISGVALGIPETHDSGGPLVHDGITSWKRLDRGTVDRRRAGSLGVYLLLAGDATGPGHLSIVAPPRLDNGPHLGYAIQWFGIALAALTFGVVVLWRDGRGSPQRREAP